MVPQLQITSFKEHSLIPVVSKSVLALVMSNRLCMKKGGKCDQVSKREGEEVQGKRCISGMS